MQGRTQAGGVSSPAFPFRGSGPALVVGNAWTLAEDLAAARALFPDAPCIAVNDASRDVKALALFSYHPERFVERGWIRRQKQQFGPDFTVHASKFVDGCPWVNHWWEDARGGGSSAWGARKLAWLIGFDPVILVGCPLSPGNYANHKPGVLMTDREVTERYAQEIAADTDWHEGAFSMSGRTREILGAPR